MSFRLLLLLAACALPTWSATLGTVVTLVGGASDLVLDEARGRLYLVNSAANRLEVYSTTQRRFLTPLRTDGRPLSAALSADGKFLYVSSYDQSSLNVVDLDQLAITRRLSLPARPEAVAVGNDGRVLITTIGTGQNNAFNTLLLVDPAAGSGQEVTAVPVSPTGPQPPGTPPAGRPALAVNSGLQTSNDGNLIFGVNNVGGNRRIVFVYEVVSATVLRLRNVASVSNVLAVAPDASKFMVGLSLFESESLIVLAQQNAANARFTFPTTAPTNFNVQQNQGGSVFSPDGSSIYSAFNIAPIQNPAARANVSRLLVNDPDNLLINQGYQLPENIAGKMIITADGRTIYALSESGFVIIPIGQADQSPIAAPRSLSNLLVNDQCGVFGISRRATVEVTNAGRGRVTATAQLLPGNNVLPGIAGGGAGGGGPGGGPIIIIPPGGGFPGGILPGFGAPGGTAAAGVAATAPGVINQNTASGSALTFQFNAQAARSLGTVAPHTFLVQSNEAVNIPPNLRVYQNNRNSESLGDVVPVEIGASDAEGLWDMVLDSVRQRLYIANSGMNRIEVFDIRARQFLNPVKVGQLPHSMALGTDGATMYVANTGGEWLSIVDLDKLEQVGKVRFPPLPFNSAVALATPQIISTSQRGPQVVVSAGANANTLWRVVGDELLPRTLNSAIFGTATTIPGPSQTMVATPNGEYVLLLAGNGFVYLYDASADEWVIGRQIFGAANQPGLLPLQGYFGPVAAGPRGQYFIANGIVLNNSLTPQTGSSGVGIGDPTGRPGATPATTRPVSAVSSAGNSAYARLSQPLVANAAALATVADTPALEIVDVNSGTMVRSVAALEGPIQVVTGTQLQRVQGRTLAVDAGLTTAYALTTSGLQIIPLTGQPSLADRPVVNTNGVVNTASYQATIAPNSLVSIFGRNMGSEQAASALPLPGSLGGTCVTLNNSPIPLLLSSPGQINFQMPPGIAAGRYQLVVRNLTRLTASNPVQVTVARYAPAVFTDQKARALVFDENGAQITPENPAKRDRPIVMYAAGLGATTGGRVNPGEASPAQPLAVTAPLKVYFGDKRYVQAEVIVDWSGLTPGLVGVYQLNLRVPGFHMRGDNLPVTISIGGVDSPIRGPVVPTVAVD
ncbi:MAG: hypothetical protein ACKV22_21490 [Bryobacteraceae bacterium]